MKNEDKAEFGRIVEAVKVSARGCMFADSDTRAPGEPFSGWSNDVNKNFERMHDDLPTDAFLSSVLCVRRLTSMRSLRSTGVTGVVASWASSLRPRQRPERRSWPRRLPNACRRNLSCDCCRLCIVSMSESVLLFKYSYKGERVLMWAIRVCCPMHMQNP